MTATNHLELIEKLLDQGKEPTNVQLGAALTQSINELNTANAIINDMAQWMGKIVALHVGKDAVALKSTLDEFVEKKVKIVTQQPEQIH
jgi:hypothetical protein